MGEEDVVLDICDGCGDLMTANDKYGYVCETCGEVFCTQCHEHSGGCLNCGSELYCEELR